MSTAAASPPAAISDESRRRLARMAWTSSLIISNLAMLVLGIVIGSAARKRIASRTRGLT